MMSFTKMHGAGNDFIMMETVDTRRDWSLLAIKMCDRHFGIGADSLILILPSDKADFQMRTFDADGLEAETCGNGIRCLAKYAFENGQISSGAHCISVETITGVSEIRLSRSGDRLIGIQVSMNRPEFRAANIPVTVELRKEGIVYIKSMLGYPINIDGKDILLNLVSMGNPHAVYFTSQPVSDFPLTQLGPKVEHLKIFPNRTNFEVARVLRRKQIEVRVWERGVGETLACGSGACAVAVAARLYDYIDNEVDIKLPGGIVPVAWDGNDEVWMSGPAEKVFTGEWPE
ncbi:MAG: diaminopimelate epimerase [Dehalococcoidales bacterium]|jgi:diaminopimelate epimerase|nr:diaminopimelate epimerase [Dehalococcoidales bacterium]MDP7416309.1 diaminopimelate epimerase [Dehalococcoidales bacterium]